MAQPQEEEGWPLGNSQLQPLNMGVPGSVSFNTFLTASPTWSVSDSSSDLDTKSTRSVFHDKSTTLRSLIGASSILELSRKSTRRKKINEPLREKKSCGPKPWLFSLCAKKHSAQGLINNAGNASSLGHFLAVERRSAASNGCRRDQSSIMLSHNFYPK